MASGDINKNYRICLGIESGVINKPGFQRGFASNWYTAISPMIRVSFFSKWGIQYNYYEYRMTKQDSIQNHSTGAISYGFSHIAYFAHKLVGTYKFTIGNLTVVPSIGGILRSYVASSSARPSSFYSIITGEETKIGTALGIAVYYNFPSSKRFNIGFQGNYHILPTFNSWNYGFSICAGLFKY